MDRTTNPDEFMAEKYAKLSSTLKKLLFQKDIKPVDLARAVDLPPPTIHRLVTGKSTRPHPSSIGPIATFFGVTTDQLLGITPLASDENAAEAKTVKTPAGFRIVPLLSWSSLSLEKSEQKPEGTIAVGNMSEESFALTMPDFSMEPLFDKGCTLIFDPAVTPVDRSYVLIKLNQSGTFLFRQLLIDGDHRYIKSLNPDISASSMRLLQPEDAIVATLMETRSNFQNQ